MAGVYQPDQPLSEFELGSDDYPDDTISDDLRPATEPTVTNDPTEFIEKLDRIADDTTEDIRWIHKEYNHLEVMRCMDKAWKDEMEPIGDGSYGKVSWLKGCTVNNEDVAVKEIGLENFNETPGEVECGERLMSDPRHAGVIAVFAAQLRRGKVLLYLPYVKEAKTLHEVRGELRNKPFSPGVFYIIMYGCFTAADKIHSKSVSHGDIHDGNILITDDNLGRAVLIDFGMAEIIKDHNRSGCDKDVNDICEVGQRLIRAASDGKFQHKAISLLKYNAEDGTPTAKHFVNKIEDAIQSENRELEQQVEESGDHGREVAESQPLTDVAGQPMVAESQPLTDVAGQPMGVTRRDYVSDWVKRGAQDGDIASPMAALALRSDEDMGDSDQRSFGSLRDNDDVGSNNEGQ